MLYDPHLGDTVVSLVGQNAYLVRVNDTTWQPAQWLRLGDYSNDPEGLAYDPTNHTLYVSVWNWNSYGGWISNINDTTGQILRNYSGGGGNRFTALALNPAATFLYTLQWSVSSGNSWSLVRISISPSTRGQGLATYFTGTPTCMLYAPVLNQLLVGMGNNRVAEFNASSLAPAGNITVGGAPTSLLYDAQDRTIWVADSGSPAISIVNASTDTIARNITAVPSPTQLVNDSTDHRVYALGSGSAKVYFLNSTTGSALGNYTVTAYPGIGVWDPLELASYDPARRALVLADQTTGLYVLATRNNSLAATVPLEPLAPDDLADDTANGVVYVTTELATVVSWPWPVVALNASSGAVIDRYWNFSSPNGVVIDGATGNPVLYQDDIYSVATYNFSIAEMNRTTGRVMRNFTKPWGALAAAYDPASRDLYFANYTGNITIAGGTNLTPFAWISAGGCPRSMVAAPPDHELFVADACGHYIDVINTTSRAIVWHISTGGGASPTGLAFDAATNRVAAVAGPAKGVEIIDPRSNTIVQTLAIAGADAITFDAAANSYLVTTSTGWRVLRISASNYSILQNLSAAYGDGLAAYDPASGNAFLGNSAGSVTLVAYDAPRYNLTFRESGLPSGSAWSVALNGTLRSTTASSIVLPEFNGTYGYLLSSASPYVPRQSYGTVAVSGKPANVSAGFGYGYAVDFNETGLPAGTAWSVTFNGTELNSTTARIELNATNGTNYPFQVGAVPSFVASASTGHLNVTGAAVGRTVRFHELFGVTFDEKGLPSGTVWGVTFNGTNTTTNLTSVMFNATNGTGLGFRADRVGGYVASPLTGTLDVSGSAVTQTIAFNVKLYDVTFEASGLPDGTGWSVTLNGTRYASSGPTLAVPEPNGTGYPFLVGSLSGFVVTPTQGNVSVAGAPTAVLIQFEELLPVTFVESGLPSGTVWSVQIGLSAFASASSSILVNETNGTGYAYQLGGVPGYRGVPSYGQFNVTGSPEVIGITFVPRTFPVTFTESGLRAGTPWSVVVGGTPAAGSGRSIVVNETNGTFGFAPGAVAGFQLGNSSGSFFVDGGPCAVMVAYSELFSVTFAERGLAPGTLWTVRVASASANSTGGTIAFALVNGSYAWTLRPVPGYTAARAGTLVVGGANLSEPVTFTPVTYAVTFTETGLPTGSTWKATVAGETRNTSGRTLTFQEPNGTFAFSVGGASGYAARPGSGSVTVLARPVGEAVAFSRLPIREYSVTFTETGLAAGTAWSVAVNGSTNSSFGDAVSFSLPNGSFTFTVGAVPGYSAASPSGSVVVTGGDVHQTVAFAPHAAQGTSAGFLGLPGILGEVVVAVALAAVVVAVPLALRRSRRPPPSRAEPAEPDAEAPGETTGDGTVEPVAPD
jgi:DNA-binding beta-propeller fold protein YncE